MATDSNAPAGVGHDDYALTPVPGSARYSWGSVAVQRFGQMSALSGFLLGATLGFGMKFWPAFWAITFGAVILEVVAILTGVVGQRTGLNTSLLARWTGFGRYGSAVIGIVIAVSTIGWFGVQNAIFAEGLHSLLGGIPVWAWAVLTGLAVTLIVIYGFMSMQWTAFITVPAFVILILYSIGSELTRHSLSGLVASGAPGPALTLAAGTTIVAGGFIVGSTVTPDMTRYNRSTMDVVKQTLVGITLGEYMIALSGVLLAHAVKSADIIHIVTTTSGALGVVILILGTLKINDWNLYNASLGFVNGVDTLFGQRINRGLMTLIVGLLGTLLSAIGILSKFEWFLTILGVSIPPIASIMVVDYFVLRRHRERLRQGGGEGRLPARVEAWNPVAIGTWVVSFAIGYWVHWGIQSINSLVCAAIIYFAAMKIVGLVQGRGTAAFRELSTIEAAGAGRSAEPGDVKAG